ncbi:hypothetical protein [Candidatus Palauibacter soopunensis]|uniref:hypothetical protein n=1 Tax=Candidatus Palauibacter soopunensis TaxID=3056739 RepID=UPI00238B034F|nr:hypothetical protein [Candidatus Palauibacter soopunensis]MDE2878625.1 hypothetical protein [Candidatus Palauibacter soopunensis]
MTLTEEWNVDHETRILIGMIVVFTAGAAVTVALNQPPVITAVCVCLVVTACLYRFLGGVEGSRFVVASFRAGGSVAVFAAGMWYINGQLVARNPPIQPALGEWIAIDRSGVPVDLRIGGEPGRSPDPSMFLRDAVWGIRHDAGTVRVTAGGRDLARIGFPSFGSLGFFDGIGMLEGRGLRYTDDLQTGMEAELYPPYPYRIRADNFGDSYNAFSVLSADGAAVVNEGSLRSKSFQVFEHEGDHFLVFVSRAVHNEPDSPPQAAFGFAQVYLTLDGAGLWTSNSRGDGPR